MAQLIKTFVGVTQSGSATSVIPFSNVPADANHTWVPEIFNIKTAYGSIAGGGNITICRGQTIPAADDPRYILIDMIQVSGADGVCTTNEYTFHDGVGNGLLVPEDSICWQASAGGFGIIILYKMKKLHNTDLLSLMVNQGASNN